MTTRPIRSGAVQSASGPSVAPVNVPCAALQSYAMASPSGSEASAVSRTSPPRGTAQGSQAACTVGGLLGGGGESSSRIVTSTDDGRPAVTSGGSAPSDTVKVSSFASASSTVEIVPVPDVRPPPIVMLANDPKSPDSAVPALSVSGIVTLFDNASDNRAVTVTGCPSSTGFGEADRLTLGGSGAPSPSRIVTSTDAGLPAVTSPGRLPSPTVNVSCSASASSVVEIVPVPDVRPPPTVMLASDPKSPASAVPADSDSGIVTLFDNAADSRAVTVTDCPSSTGFGAADRLTLGVGGGVVSLVKVSTAMGSLENLPVPAMRVMTPCGLVSGLDRENSSPSSVPASYGKRFTTRDCRH